MKPYYKGPSGVIYLGDCTQILPDLDEDVDLIVTDPPYGIKYKSPLREIPFGDIAGDESTEVGEVAISLAIKKLRSDRHAYFFGKWTFDLAKKYVSSPVELIWDKDMPVVGNVKSPWWKQHEYIQFCTRTSSGQRVKRGGLTAKLRKGSVLRHKRPNATAIRHPTEKPVSLLRELIESSSSMGETVLDPFLGGGSTALAAALEDRRFIGIELEERWCELAAKRLDEFESRMSLFAPHNL